MRLVCAAIVALGFFWAVVTCDQVAKEGAPGSDRRSFFVSLGDLLIAIGIVATLLVLVWPNRREN